MFLVFLMSDDLPLKVGEVHLVRVAQRYSSNAACRQIERYGAPQSAHPHDQRMGRAEFLLPFNADFRQEDVAAITQQLIVV